MVPNIDNYWLLAGPWTVFMHGHVWSFNQSQTRKSHTDVWRSILTSEPEEINSEVICGEFKIELRSLIP